jgi:hypothetical protein
MLNWSDHMTLQTSVYTKDLGKSIFSMLCMVRDILCGLMVRVPGSRTEMYCVSCEVRTEFICVM